MINRSLRLAAAVALSLSAGVAHAGADSRLPAGAILAGGTNTAIFTKPDGQVWGWGANDWGQIGNGSTAAASTPVKASLSADVIHVASQTDFTLAIDTSGYLWSWGHNDKGQLGRGTPSTTASFTTPQTVDSNGNWRTVAAGATHAVGITIDGTLWGWGANGSSQLCKAATTAESRPLKLGTETNWIAVGAGLNFTVALKADGTLWGCGTNANGQLNQGTTGGTKPALMKLGSDHWRAFSVGTGHVVAIRDDGTLWTWGLNDKGQLGNGSTTDVNKQFQASTATWRAVSAGDRHSLGIKTDGSHWGWGDNTYYQLSTSDNTSPHKSLVRIGSQSNWEYTTAGGTFSVAVRATGTLETWGKGAVLGTGQTANSASSKFPQPSGQPAGWYKLSKPGMLAGGTSTSLAVRCDGVLQLWGLNNEGQLGNGNQIDNDWTNWVPRIPSNVSSGPWITVAGGEQHSVAIKADGTLWAWGGNNVGEQALGTSTSTPSLTPHKILSGTTFIKVYAHYAQVFALAGTGQLYAWGDNAEGQLGTNLTAAGSSLSPHLVVGGPWAAVGSGAHTTHFISSKGELFAAGQGGAIEDFSVPDIRTPTRVGAATNWLAVAEGLGFGIALAADGKPYGYGNNEQNQLGNNSIATLVKTPSLINSVTRFFRISIAQMTTLGTTTKGQVYGWGVNGQGELCRGDFDAASSPSLSYFFAPRELVGGGNHFLSAVGGNRLSCGADDGGQLGSGNKGDLAADPLIIPGPF